VAGGIHPLDGTRQRSYCPRTEERSHHAFVLDGHDRDPVADADIIATKVGGGGLDVSAKVSSRPEAVAVLHCVQIL
jgi:hypothetical protein